MTLWKHVVVIVVPTASSCIVLVRYVDVVTRKTTMMTTTRKYYEKISNGFLIHIFTSIRLRLLVSEYVTYKRVLMVILTLFTQPATAFLSKLKYKHDISSEYELPPINATINAIYTLN